MQFSAAPTRGLIKIDRNAQLLQMSPIKKMPWIGFAVGGNVLVSRHRFNRISGL